MAVWTAKPDAKYNHIVESFDTPFTPLEGTVASYGLRLDVREPHATFAWSGAEASFLENISDVAETTPANLFTTFTNATFSTALLTDARAPNLVEYWSAGAPTHLGVTTRGRVALHYRLILRPQAGRAWFKNTATVTLSLAFAGQGYVRCTKTLAGVTTELNVGGTAGFTLTEADYLDQGYRFTSVITMATGDAIDVYYVQDRENWGGLVAKAVEGSTQTNALAGAAPVVGCGLFDTGTQPPVQTWHHVENIQVSVDEKNAPQATLTVPLLNPNRHDGFGWEWKKDNESDPGYLACWNGGVQQFTLRRGRLVRITTGYEGEEEKVFTGIVQDLPAPKDGHANVRCIGFEYRLIESRNKLEPDPISYMTFGYRKLSAVFEPVYGITAYDAWTIENAVADMAYRAGIDASRMRQTLTSRKANGTIVNVTFGSETFLKFRARSVSGIPIKLERAVHYGNVGTTFTEAKPVDDPYLFAPESRDDSWARVLEISDRYGYDIRFDELGDFVLSTRANACFAYEIVAGDSGAASTRKTHPSAYKGTYQEWAIAATITKTVTGARIDAALPRGPGLGQWTSITVTRVSDAQVVATHNNVDVTTGVTAETFYYDFRHSATGVNATILTLYSGDFDTYTVTFTGTGVATRRLDTIFVYYRDPARAEYALTTGENALDVTPQDSGDDMRNMVIVVGKRKATVTDSEKLETNPNNADAEFIVEAAVDAASISDPTAKNYVGMRRESVIIDQSIADQDFAAYLARTFVFRYRAPKPPAEIVHTLIAELKLRACLTGNETTFQSVTPTTLLWVTGFTHDIGPDGAYTTTIRTSAWPEFPSFEPRDDIDIDADFNGVPVANVKVQYTSCTGTLKTNLASGLAVESKDGLDIRTLSAVSVQPAAGGQPEFLDMATQHWPPVPGTVMIRPSGGGFTAGVLEEYRIEGIVGGLEDNSALASELIRIASKGMYTVRLAGAARPGGITSVKVVVWRQVFTGAVYFRDIELTATAQNVGFGFSWSYNDEEQQLTITNHNASPPFMYVSIKVTYDKYTATTANSWVTNTPYHHLMNVDYRDSNRKIYLPWKQGDNSSLFTRDANVTTYDVKYRRLGAVDGTGAYTNSYASGSPFFDVTTSELGQLVNLTFDALVSGLYRISVKSAFDHTTVAYLTEPTADPEEPESHWQYITAGAARAFNWDGVDQLGTWNRQQSEDYAALAQGWFEDDAKEPIGAGWYVWNRERTSGGYAPLALISDARNADGTPVYGQGTYAAWYFQVECKNDTLAALEDAGKPYPRVVKTLEPGPGEAPPTYSPAADAAVVYTHMPAPTQLELAVTNWNEAFPYDPSVADHANDSHWSTPWYNSNVDSPVAYEALINNAKPVRIQFRLVPRGGTLWTGRDGDMQVKLTRHVHLKASIYDQFVIGEGGNWPDTSTEQRTVHTRRLHNDDHTITFVDQGWRKARTLKNSVNTTGVTQWVFRPQDFRKNFRGVENEPIEFGDYLQLEEVPKWEQQRTVAGQHSRMTLAFMAYLFYLSAYCVDRSGRRCWGVNRKFVDRSKITTNTYAHWWNPASPTVAATNSTYQMELLPDPVHQQRRSIVCRQWLDEGTWQADQRTIWGTAVDSTLDKLFKHKWMDHEPAATQLDGATWPVLTTDEHSQWHRSGGRLELPAPFANLTRQLGSWNGGSPTTHLGPWTWETDPLWIPCVTRDFHPAFLVPPMVDVANEEGLRANYIYAISDTSGYDANTNTGRDVAKNAIWSSRTRDMSEGTASLKSFAVGTRVDAKAATVGANSIDYARQDDTVHYEDFRGLYSRGPRPSEQVRKLAPAQPYYINQLRYAQIAVRVGDGHWHRNAHPPRSFPNYTANVTNWFDLNFRSEYLWESSTCFPVDYQGRERLDRALVWKTHFVGTVTALGPQQSIFDGGAWVGWKEDNTATAFLLCVSGSPFLTGRMPVDVGPRLPTSTDVYKHLILVNERRRVPV